MLTIVTAHTFCASRDNRVSYRWYPLIQGYAWFKTMRRKQNLASALGIQKENRGLHCNIARHLQTGKIWPNKKHPVFSRLTVDNLISGWRGGGGGAFSTEGLGSVYSEFYGKFSNSLIIHQAKTKEITTVEEV